MNINDYFIQVEKKFNLNDSVFKGYHFWTYNRFDIYSVFEEKIKQYQSTLKINRSKQLLLYLSRIPDLLTHSFMHQWKGKNVNYIVKVHPRRIKYDNKYKSIYTDELDFSETETLSFEQPSPYIHLSPAETSNLVYLDNVEMSARMHYISEKFLRLADYCEIRSYLTSFLEPIFNELESIASVTIDRNSLIERVCGRYYYYKQAKKYWNRILDVTQPKVTLCVVYYDIFSMTLVEASHEHNIPSIEIQHGTIDDRHIAYNYDKSTNSICLPDYFFAFSNFWKEYIKLGCNTKIIPIGFEFSNKQRNNYNRIKTNGALLALSQRTIGDKLSKIVMQIDDFIQANHLKVPILFKLHPSEYEKKEEYCNIFTYHKNIHVITEQVPLYQLLSMSSCQIGFYSTTLFEGLGFKLKTFIIDPDKPVMKRLCMEGYAKKYTKPEDIFKEINNNELKINGLWKANAKKNFWNELEKIQNKNVTE